LLGTFATSGRRPFLLLLHILVSFCVAVALTVLGILLLADAQIIIKRLPTESAEAVYLTENFKPVGYITLIMAGGYVSSVSVLELTCFSDFLCSVHDWLDFWLFPVCARILVMGISQSTFCLFSRLGMLHIQSLSFNKLD
jgi:hypothetical protein